MDKAFFLVPAALALAACEAPNNSPLFFGQGATVGISLGASATSAGTPEIVVGVKQADVAVVPTIIPGDVELGGKDRDGNGERRAISATHTNNSVGENGTTQSAPGTFDRSEGITTDALSTFGSFSSNTNTTNGVSIGIFFSTGVAAQNLSRGFMCAVGPTHRDCSSKAEPDDG